MEALADPSSLSGLDENDPRSIAEWAKRMGKELGEEAGEDWDEMVEEMLEEELGDKNKDGTAGPAKEDNLGWA
jgi:hypothetical protein